MSIAPAPKILPALGFLLPGAGAVRGLRWPSRRRVGCAWSRLERPSDSELRPARRLFTTATYFVGGAAVWRRAHCYERRESVSTLTYANIAAV